MLTMALSIFETLLNRSLALDARIDKRLHPLAQKCLQVSVQDLDLHFYIFFTKEGIQLKGEKGKGSEENKVDVHVKAPVAALMSFFVSRNLTEATAAGLVVEGDFALALEIQGFAQNLDMDWEEMLSRYTGDVIAHPVARFLKGLRKKKSKLLESFFLSSGIFLQEELKCLPTGVEVENFNQSLDNLRNQVDRCEARVKILEKRRNCEASGLELLGSDK